MVDIRPLLFLNALMLLLLAISGIVSIQEQSFQSPNMDVAETTGAPAPEQNAQETPEKETQSDSAQTEPKEDPIFADQLPPHKDDKVLKEIENVVKQGDGEPIIIEQTPKEKDQSANTGKLTVRSNVYDDVVLIDGKPYGPSKLTVALTPGTYSVEVTKKGYKTWRKSITVQRNGDHSLNAELERYTTVNYKDGNWENNVQTGEGRYIDGSRIDYQGSFVNGRFHGFGSARFGDGSKYQGEWFEGTRKGSGTFVSANGDTYVGQFSDDEFNGEGTLTKANGDIYTGYWIGGALNGQGSLTTRDGMLYVGGFSDNLFHGSGTLTYPDGGTYEGSFSNGLFHGKGVEIYANGKKYEGQFIEGLYHGKGEILNPNGSKISGTFKDGEPFGKVTLTTAEGEVFTARSSEPGVCYRPKSYRATECPELDGW